VARRGFQQNSDVDAATACSIQCIDHRGDVVCNEADEKEVTLRVTDEIQEYLLRAASGDEWCRRARPNELDTVFALRLLVGEGCTDQDPGQHIA